MNNAITNRHAADLNAKNFFRAIVTDISNAGSHPALIETIEMEAASAKGDRIALTEAALNFAHGFDHTATMDLIDNGISGAERIVRRLRIEIADHPMMWNLKNRQIDTTPCYHQAY